MSGLIQEIVALHAKIEGSASANIVIIKLIELDEKICVLIFVGWRVSSNTAIFVEVFFVQENIIESFINKIDKNWALIDPVPKKLKYKLDEGHLGVFKCFFPQIGLHEQFLII